MVRAAQLGCLCLGAILLLWAGLAIGHSPANPPEIRAPSTDPAQPDLTILYTISNLGFIEACG